MFGKRGNEGTSRPAVEARPVPTPSTASAQVAVAEALRPAAARPQRALEPPRAPPIVREKSESYYDTKSQVFGALIDTIDLSQLAKLEPDNAREEIRDIVNDIIAIKNFAMSISEQ